LAGIGDGQHFVVAGIQGEVAGEAVEAACAAETAVGCLAAVAGGAEFKGEIGLWR